MNFKTLVALFSPVLIACKKDGPADNETCFGGRYVTGGCWQVVQLLEPVTEGLPTAPYGTYEHTFGTENLPEQYKNGQPFYFTVKSIDSNKKYLTYCIPTKHFIELGSFSNTPCGEVH